MISSKSACLRFIWRWFVEEFSTFDKPQVKLRWSYITIMKKPTQLRAGFHLPRMFTRLFFEVVFFLLGTAGLESSVKVAYIFSWFGKKIRGFSIQKDQRNGRIFSEKTPPSLALQGHCIILGCNSGQLQVWDASSAELLSTAKVQRAKKKSEIFRWGWVGLVGLVWSSFLLGTWWGVVFVYVFFSLNIPVVTIDLRNFFFKMMKWNPRKRNQVCVAALSSVLWKP